MNESTARPALYLTRAEHDRLITRDQALLQTLFRECDRPGAYWTLAGVEFRGLSPALIDAAEVAIQPLPGTIEGWGET